MRVVLPQAKYASQERQRQFVRQLDERLSALPVFSSVALGSAIPLHPLGFGSRSLAIDGVTWDAASEAPTVFYVAVGPRYLETLGLTVLQGRPLTKLDDRPEQEGVPVVYVPFDAEPGAQRAVSIIVRAADSATGKAAAAAALGEQVSAMDPDLPVFGIQTLDEAVLAATRPSLTIGSWFMTIALVALVLATVGLYALTAHGVAQRSHEIGVRMALGARSGQVMWLFVRRTIVQLAIGLTLGIGGALGIGQLLSGFLRDTNPRDPMTIAIVVTILVVVALTASVWPARKAARIDPVEALRAD
jgi:putative ABC transport system permease protein